MEEDLYIDEDAVKRVDHIKVVVDPKQVESVRILGTHTEAEHVHPVTGQRGYTNIFEQDDIDWLLGFDEDSYDDSRIFWSDLKLYFEFTPFLWRWRFYFNRQNVVALVGPFGIGVDLS